MNAQARRLCHHKGMNRRKGSWHRRLAGGRGVLCSQHRRDACATMNHRHSYEQGRSVSVELNCRGREEWLALPSLRTVRAVFPHTALRSVGSFEGLNETGVSLTQAAKPMIRKVGVRLANRAAQPLSASSTCGPSRQPDEPIRQSTVSLPRADSLVKGVCRRTVRGSIIPRSLPDRLGRIEFANATDWSFTSGCSPPSLTETQ